MSFRPNADSEQDLELERNDFVFSSKRPKTCEMEMDSKGERSLKEIKLAVTCTIM